MATFKKSADLRRVAAGIPADRLLIETDSPYLAPVPHRGKTNTPANVPYVARQLAALKGLSEAEVAAATSANFERLFAKTLRRALGSTQEEFAARFHIPVGTLRDWERGRAEPGQTARAYLRAIAGDAAAVQHALERIPVLAARRRRD